MRRGFRKTIGCRPSIFGKSFRHSMGNRNMVDSCPHCGEALPKHVDAFCPMCRDDLSEPPTMSPIERTKLEAELSSRPIHTQPIFVLIAVVGLVIFVVSFGVDILRALGLIGD